MNARGVRLIVASMMVLSAGSGVAQAAGFALREGSADWKAIFEAAEKVGGAEYYLVEQEGSRFSELETAERCLKAFRATHSR